MKYNCIIYAKSNSEPAEYYILKGYQ